MLCCCFVLNFINSYLTHLIAVKKNHFFVNQKLKSIDLNFDFSIKLQIPNTFQQKINPILQNSTFRLVLDLYKIKYFIWNLYSAITINLLNRVKNILSKFFIVNDKFLYIERPLLLNVIWVTYMNVIDVN